MPNPDSDQGKPLRFRLYVAGDSPNSRQALTNFEALRQVHCPPGIECELEVVDVLTEPARALEDHVLVTPTLIALTTPRRRVVGNLSDLQAVLPALFGGGAMEDLGGGSGLPGAQVRRLARQLAAVEASLEALIANQADAVLSPDRGIAILLSQARAALQHSEVRYRQLAHHDPLTGLPNRLLFATRLEHAVAHVSRRGSTIALLYLDVDRFKAINDTLGHGVGDLILSEFGRRLRHCVRDIDTVARVGGDEFAILVENLVHSDDARRLAVKLIGAITQPMQAAGQTIHTSTSIGIALLPRDADTPEALWQAADQAMYRAKAKGRGSYEFYRADLNTDFSVVPDLEAELAAALSDGRLELHYQPEVDPANGKVVAMEALLRWHHPQRGLLPAGAFVAAAENTRLMDAIGDWVLHTACAQALAWRRAGHGVRLTVNVSARELGRRDLVDRFLALYADLGIAAGELSLALELPERLLAAASRNTGALEALSPLGIHLSVDHFGRDLVPVAALKSLPFVRVKIDGHILDALVAGFPGHAIARGLIALGHGLGLEVAVSGVETQEQWEAIRPEHCDEVQGFLFSRPLTADAATALLKRHTPLLH